MAIIMAIHGNNKGIIMAIMAMLMVIMAMLMAIDGNKHSNLWL